MNNVKSWGRWATVGLALMAMLGGQIAALAAVTWWFGMNLTRLVDMASDGVVAILMICISTPIQVLLLALMGRQAGASAADYLGLTLPRKRDVLVGIIAVSVFMVFADGISLLLSRDLVTQFQLDLYRTASAAGWLPWLLLTVVVVAPIGEETLFRGFLFRGWHRSAKDAWAVITVIALLWALIHLQYDFYNMAQVCAYGLLLGWLRWKTGSTILTILLHGLIRFEGLFETFIAVHQ
jgi:membrane protease YdiL (CAAX protease family)